MVSILTRPEGRVQLPGRVWEVSLGSWFQSSPVPKDGCNSGRTPRADLPGVSILTRPEGRVQPNASAC